MVQCHGQIRSIKQVFAEGNSYQSSDMIMYPHTVPKKKPEIYMRLGVIDAFLWPANSPDLVVYMKHT